jgi:hypothetical protein
MSKLSAGGNLEHKLTLLFVMLYGWRVKEAPRLRLKAHAPGDQNVRQNQQAIAHRQQHSIPSSGSVMGGIGAGLPIVKRDDGGGIDPVSAMSAVTGEPMAALAHTLGGFHHKRADGGYINGVGLLKDAILFNGCSQQAG